MWPGDQDLERRLAHPANAPVIAYLKGRDSTASAELVHETELACAELNDRDGEPGALTYCPDPENFAYRVLHAPNGVIYGLAEDDGRLVLRVPNVMEPPALGDAAFIHALLSDATKRFWGAFPVFAEDTIDRDQAEARAIIRKWLLRAREYADQG